MVLDKHQDKIWIKLYLAHQSTNHQCFIEPRFLPPKTCVHFLYLLLSGSGCRRGLVEPGMAAIGMESMVVGTQVFT